MARSCSGADGPAVGMSDTYSIDSTEQYRAVLAALDGFQGAVSDNPCRRDAR